MHQKQVHVASEILHLPAILPNTPPSAPHPNCISALYDRPNSA